MKRIHRRKVFWGIFAGLILVAGCVANIPPYPDQAGTGTVEMAPFERNNATFMVPAGWAYHPPAMDAIEENLGGWNKGARFIRVECWTQFLSRDELENIAHAKVNRLQGKTRQVEGPFRIETEDPSGAQPVLERYLIGVVADGKPTDLVVLLAWKMPSASKKGRRYVAFGVAPPRDKDELETAFVAMLRTFKD